MWLPTSISELASMSSDFFVFDGPFFTDPFSPFSDSAIDVLQEIPDAFRPLNHEDPVCEIDSIAGALLLASSPPSRQLENLSLCQTTHFGNSANGFPDFSVPDVKAERSQTLSDSPALHHCQGHCSCSNCELDNAVKMMQRSYSSNSIDEKQPRSLFRPGLDCLLESPEVHPQVLRATDGYFPSGHMRRVCSTGDLENSNPSRTSRMLSSSPLATESSFMEEASGVKVGRYNAEEKKERILRYRAKRTQRNFNKTIKYACRKTLADNRPRIRGRFARNDEPGDLPKTDTCNLHGAEDELWQVKGYHEEDYEGTRKGQLSDGYCLTQFHYFSYP